MSRSRRSAPATLLLLCVFHAGPLARAAAAPPVAGKVTDMAGRGLEGAHVTVQVPQGGEPVSAVTDAEGRFRLDTPDGAGLSFTAPGRLRVEVPAEAVSSQMTVGLPLASALVARVRDADTERPVPGARISILGRDGDLRENGDREPLRTATSGADGRAALDGLPPGIYDLRAEAHGYEVGNLPSVRLLPEARPTVLVWMDPLHTFVLEGRVTDPEGKPLEGARVGLLKIRRLVDAVATNEKGRYRLEVRSNTRDYERDYPWPGEILAVAPGLSPTLEVRDGPLQDGHLDVDFRLGPPAGVHGRVRDEKGRPVAGIHVEASMLIPYIDHHTGERSSVDYVELPSILPDLDDETGVVTDTDGRFRIQGLPAGTLRLSPSRRGYPPTGWSKFEVQAGETIEDVALAWQEGASIRGVVEEQSGRPLPQAHVLAVGQTEDIGTPPTIESDDAGRFRLGGLDPHGTFRVEASAEGFCPETVEDVRAGGDPLRIRLRPAGVVSGVAYDAETGEPVQVFGITREPHRSGKVKLEPSRSKVFTPPTGVFRWEGVPAGLYRFQIHAPGYLGQERKGVEVRPAEETALEPFHLSRGKEVRGVVLDLDGMRPVAGASVEASAVPISGAEPLCCSPFELGDPDRVVTDEDGGFRVSGLPTGEITVVVESPGRARAGVAFRLGEEDRARDVEILMGPGASVEANLRVQDEPRGADPSSRSFILEPVDDPLRAIEGPEYRSAEGTDPVVFSYVPPGRYRLLVSGLAVKERLLDLHHGDRVRVDLEPTGTLLTGRVLRGGVAVADARVALTPVPPTGDWFRRVACRTQQGVFECGPLAPGSWEVFVAKDTDQSTDIPEILRMQTIEVPDGEGRMEMDLVLPDRVFSGRLVRDDDGEGLVGADLLLLDPSAGGFSSFISAASTDEGGSFEMTVSRPGTYRLVVDSGGPGMAGWVLRGDGTVKIPEDGLRGQVLRLGPSGGVTGRVTGRVTGPDGRPVEEAVVLPLEPNLAAMFGGLPLTSFGGGGEVTDMDGRFEIGSAPVGTVLVVTAPGLASVWVPVSEDRSAPFEVSLSSGASLEILLPESFSDSSDFRLTLDKSGLPMPVVLTPFFMESLMEERVSILATGSLLLSHVPPGTWRLRFRLGEREWSRTVELEDGSPVRLDLSD